MGGAVGLQSNPAQQTDFWLRLPRNRAPGAAEDLIGSGQSKSRTFSATLLFYWRMTMSSIRSSQRIFRNRMWQMSHAAALRRCNSGSRSRTHAIFRRCGDAGSGRRNRLRDP